jgi:hypothetical protein
MDGKIRPLRIWIYFAAGLVSGAYIHGLSRDRMAPVLAIAAFVVIADIIWPVKRSDKTHEDYTPVTLSWEFSLEKFLKGFRKKPTPPDVK